jgi:hypothetical protein
VKKRRGTPPIFLKKRYKVSFNPAMVMPTIYLSEIKRGLDLNPIDIRTTGSESFHISFFYVLFFLTGFLKFYRKITKVPIMA